MKSLWMCRANRLMATKQCNCGCVSLWYIVCERSWIDMALHEIFGFSGYNHYFYGHMFLIWCHTNIYSTSWINVLFCHIRYFFHVGLHAILIRISCYLAFYLFLSLLKGSPVQGTIWWSLYITFPNKFTSWTWV